MYIYGYSRDYNTLLPSKSLQSNWEYKTGVQTQRCKAKKKRKIPILQFSKFIHKPLGDLKMQFLKYPVINHTGKESEKECIDRYMYN